MQIFSELRKVVEVSGDKYEYVDANFTVSRNNKMVTYKLKRWSKYMGAMVEEFGQMVDNSKKTWISYKKVHNTVDGIELDVRHADVKKYLIHIIDIIVDIFKNIADEFAVMTK